jgi:hypothetical protein
MVVHKFGKFVVQNVVCGKSNSWNQDFVELQNQNGLWCLVLDCVD